MATSGSTRTTLISPFQYFADPTRARPIFNGFIFIGRVDGDPTNTADQIPVQVICECGGSPVNVTQPIRTGPGGLPIYNGSPAQIVVCRSNYSITLQDNNRVQVYHSPNVQSGFVNQPITHTTLAAAMADDNSSRQVIKLLERGGAEYRRAANQAEYDGFPNSLRFTDAGNLLWVLNDVPAITSTMMGMDTTGIMDTSSLLRDALSVNHKFRFNAGAYLWNTQVNLTSGEYEIYGVDAEIRCSTPGLVALNPSECDSLHIHHLTVNGQGNLRRFIDGASTLDAHNLEIHDLFGRAEDNSVLAISANVDSSVDSIDVYDCHIYNISAHTGGGTGQSSGACRAVFVSIRSDHGATVSIRENNFHDVYGREGDIVQVISTIKLVSTYTYIHHNRLAFANRRNIKCQSDNVVVHDNLFLVIRADSPNITTSAGVCTFGTDGGGNQTERGVCINNEVIDFGGMPTSTFAYTGASDGVCSGNRKYLMQTSGRVRNPFIQLRDTTSRIEISDNYIETATPAFFFGGVNNSTRISITDNKIKVFDTTRSVMEGISNGTSMVIEGNEVLFDQSSIDFTGFLGFIFLGAATFSGNVVVKNNIVDSYIAAGNSRGTIAYFNNADVTGLRLIDNFRNSTGNPISHLGATLTDVTAYYNNSHNVKDQDVS